MFLNVFKSFNFGWGFFVFEIMGLEYISMVVELVVNS